MGLSLILTKKIEYKYINFKITLKYFMDLGVYLDMPLVFLFKNWIQGKFIYASWVTRPLFFTLRIFFDYFVARIEAFLSFV